MADAVHDDQPQGREELGDVFAHQPVTQAAHRWLREKKLNLARGFREALARKAATLGRQLTLEETQVFEKSRREHIAWLFDRKPDDGHPDPFTCEWPLGCTHTVRPEVWNAVKDGRPATDREGLRIRKGNFVLLRMKDGLPDRSGEFTRLGFCRDHLEECGGESYSSKRAEHLMRHEVFKERLPQARFFAPMNGVRVNGRTA